MSRGRIAIEADDSLDLLLDTICNTFGGVVFISILVVVMVNLTSKSIAVNPPDEVAQSQLIDLEIRREQTHGRLRRLRIAATDRKLAVDALTSNESVEMARQLQSRNAEHSRLIEQKSNELGQISSAQIRTNELAQEMKQRKSTIKQRKSTLAGLKRKLDTEIKKHSRSVQLPRLRRTNKKPVAFYLKDGKLFAVQRPGRHVSKWENLALSDEVVKTTVGNKEFVDPVAGKGTPVNTAGSKAAIERKISQFDPKVYYIQIFVWQGSFKSFAAIRKILVDGHYEYALKPLPQEMRVSIGSGQADEVQ